MSDVLEQRLASLEDFAARRWDDPRPESAQWWSGRPLLLGTFGAFMGMLAGPRHGLRRFTYAMNRCWATTFRWSSTRDRGKYRRLSLIAIVAAWSPGARAAQLDMRSAIAYE